MIKNKLKYAFLTFIGLAALTLTSGIVYLESASFANSVKKMISERSPQKFGVVGDFSNLKLYFFPPGVGVASPKIRISKDNVSQIPMDGQIEAKELRVSFAPIQMFSGVLQVSEVEVRGGAIQGVLYGDEFNNKPKKKKETSHLSWQDLFELQINGFRLEDTYLNITTKLPGGKNEELVTELVVKNLLIKKSRVDNREGFVSNATVNAVRITPPPSLNRIPIHEANQLQWDIELNDQGLKLNPLTADLSGIRFQLKGDVKGNLLDSSSDPQVEAQAEIHSDLGTFFLANLNDDHWGGEVDGKAKISASLKDPVETLKAQFSVTGKDLHWDQVTAKKLQSEGDLDLKAKKIALKSLEVEDDGKLKMTSTDIPFHFDQAFQANIELENAGIHWLGGIVPKDVAMLDGKVSGKVRAEFSSEKGKSWRLVTQDDLRVDQFALKPKIEILKPVFPIKLHGIAEVSPKGVDFKDFSVVLNKTQLQVGGGVHSGAEGFALTAKGPVDLKEFKQIAGNDISGEGDIEALIHGPAAEVLLDFMPKLKDASYLGLHYGNIDGKVTYDVGTSELRFSNFHANYKNTFYSLEDGFIDLAGGDDIKLPFNIHSGKIEDLSEVLEKLTHNISWYPKTLKGEIHGSVLVGGKISTPKLKILADIEGSDWTLFGERARRSKMKIGFDEGVYFAKDVSITKTSGVITGDIFYTASTDSLKWNFETQNMSFLDVDFLDRLELPAKSKIEFKSEGEGPLSHLKSKTEGKLLGTEFKGESFDPSSITVEVGESTFRANLSVFGGKLSSQLKYALVPKQPSSLRVDLTNFDFSPALLVLNPKLLDDPELIGEASGHLQLDFLSTQSEFARGELQVKSYKLGKTGFLLSLLDPVNVPVQLGYFHFPPSRLQFGNSELVMGGEGKRGEVDFSLTGQADLAIAELFSSSVSKATGKADTDIRIHGPLKSLAVNGEMNFTGARVLMKWLQTPLEDLDGTIRFRQGLIEVESMEAYLGEELFSLNGKIQTFTDRFPEMDLHAQFEDNKVKMFPLDFIQVRGLASLTGKEPPYVIAGNLEVPQALWTKSFGQSSGGPTSRGDRFLPVDQEKQIGSNLFKLDLNVNAPQGFNIKNEIIDAEFRGKVKVIGPPDNAKLLGEGSLVQGKVLFKDKPFILESVKVTFDDPFQLNPKFSATGISDVNQYKIRVVAYGSASSWKAEFSSTPFLAESEIFSLLASGYTSADTNRYKNKDRSYVSQGEAASLILHSMDFSKDMQNKTGFQFDVEEAVDANSANSIFRPTNLSDNVASPKLVLKRQLGRNIWFSVGSTVGVGSENQKEVNAEYKLTPSVSALGVWNDTEEVGSAGTQTSFGLDLKFNKRFK